MGFFYRPIRGREVPENSIFNGNLGRLGQTAGMLELQEVSRVYTTATGSLRVLDRVSLSVEGGSSAAIVGPSGSGKSTLLGLSAGLDLPDEGKVRLNGEELSQLDEEARTRFRNENIGFVFQNFQLIPTLNALENVAIPLELNGHRKALSIAREWLERVGLKDRQTHYPSQLSGGEQQRVAIARAQVAGPAILFADEPTGNLDEATSHLIEDLLFQVHTEQKNTLILVTHDPVLASRTDRRFALRAGKLVHHES